MNSLPGFSLSTSNLVCFKLNLLSPPLPPSWHICLIVYLSRDPSHKHRILPCILLYKTLIILSLMLLKLSLPHSFPGPDLHERPCHRLLRGYWWSQIWGWILVLLLLSVILILGKLLNLSMAHFLICKMKRRKNLLYRVMKWANELIALKHSTLCQVHCKYLVCTTTLQNYISIKWDDNLCKAPDIQ